MTELTWFILLSVGIAAVPGPTNLLVIAHATAGHRRGVACLLLGIALANLMWVLVCATGLAALLLTSQTIFAVLRVIDAGYLTYLGLQMLLSPPTALQIDALTARREKGLVAQGFLTSATNPKAVLFYSAFLPQFASTADHVGVSAFAWGSLYVAIALLVFSFYAIAARSLAARLGHHNTLMRKVAGAGLVGSGVSLLRWRPS